MLTTMPGEIIGRDEELGVLYAFLEEPAGPGQRALVLEGPPGIGKSTLWAAGVETARARGARVLAARPAEAERAFAYAGLADLFEGVVDDVLPALPRPRRRALEVAFLTDDAPVEGTDPRSVAVAVRASLELLAADGPVVLALDDVQWLDVSSTAALAFALRRVDVVSLLARRVGEDGESPLERALRPTRLAIGPLSVGATHGLLQARLGRTFPRPVLLRLHESSGGNPFYALELARTLEPRPDPTQPLPVPESLEALLRARLGGLPRSSREGLALVAVLGRSSPAQLAAAGVAQSELDPALAAHVLSATDRTVRFEHPLLASVAYQDLDPAARRRAHARAGSVVIDDVERARHLALSAPGPDEDVASAAEAAAELAASRGAPAAAAELYEHALRLTLLRGRDHGRRRAIAAARAHLAAGDIGRARQLADDLLGDAAPGLERAEALMLRGDLDVDAEAWRAALREAADNTALQVELHRKLSWDVRFTEGMPAAERHARAALDLAGALDDTARALALAAASAVRFAVGETDAPALAEEAYALASSDPRLQLSVGLQIASTFVFVERYDRARELLESLLSEWGDRDEPARAQILWRFGLLELYVGAYAAAATHAAAARDAHLQYTDDEDDTGLVFLIARVAAHRGEFEQARELSLHALSLPAHNPWFAGLHEAVLGLAEFWGGDASAAVRRFEVAEAIRGPLGLHEPALAWWRADYAEALLVLGRVEEAVALIGPWETKAVRLGRGRVLAEATRTRGLVAAAHEDVADALRLLERAVELHGAAQDPFGRARALLALGIVRRRARQKRTAREAVAAALAEFERLGAGAWVARATAELGRIGGRARIDGLTPAERRVAALVAEGKTNREVAAALFLGERTVASHLTHIYAKLGVRSRTELASKVQTF